MIHPWIFFVRDGIWNMEHGMISRNTVTKFLRLGRVQNWDKFSISRDRDSCASSGFTLTVDLYLYNKLFLLWNVSCHVAPGRLFLALGHRRLAKTFHFFEPRPTGFFVLPSLSRGHFFRSSVPAVRFVDSVMFPANVHQSLNEAKCSLGLPELS